MKYNDEEMKGMLGLACAFVGCGMVFGPVSQKNRAAGVIDLGKPCTAKLNLTKGR